MLCFGSWITRSNETQPFPVRQLFVLALCRICEPIAFMSIFPYVYYMIESFHITTDDRQIAFYAGMVTSSFAFAEFLAGVVWGRLSDRFGRKPILLCGLAGTGISMTFLGFAKTLPAALIARALGGLLNGNIGVLQTTVAEVVTVDAHRPLGFSIMPVVWCLGAIIGSSIGGGLADPVRNYGWQQGTILDQYPFLLPNLVCTFIVILGMTVGIFFLEETHEDQKHRRDYGLEIGRWMLRGFQKASPDEITSCKRDYTEQTLTLMHDDDFPPDYRSTASSPQLSPTFAPVGLPPPAYQSIEASPRNSMSLEHALHLDVEDAEALTPETTKPKRTAAVQSAFTKQVIFNIVSYGILAYHTISAEQLLPVLFSMPESDKSPNLPFHFTGGFGLPTKSIGGILSVQGLIQVVATLFVFPPLNRRLGSLTLFRITVFTYPFLYLLVPYLTLLPHQLRMVCVYLILIWKVSAQAFTFPSSHIMLANSAPSNKVLGTLNGAAASSASLSRSFGPTFSGLLQSAGLASGILGLPWWVNGMVATVGVALSLLMVEQKQQQSTSEKQSSDDGVLSAGASHADCTDEENEPLVASGLPNASLETMQPTPGSPNLIRVAIDHAARRGSVF